MKGKAHQGKVSFGRRVAAIATMAALASAMSSPAAFADNTASAGDQTGTGQTDLIVRLSKTGEYGGTAAQGVNANPDENHDGVGDNLAFTVPASISFVASTDGALTGPSPSAARIENRSAYAIHVSSLDVDPAEKWSIVDDVSTSTNENAVDLQIGPRGDMLNIADYLSKKAVGTASAWNMESVGTADRNSVPLETSGAIGNVAADIASDQTIGAITWYVTAGRAS